MSKEPCRLSVGPRLAAVALAAAATLAACSSASTSSVSPGASPATTSPAMSTSTGPLSSAMCQHVRSLRMSLANLTKLSLSANSASQIRKDLTNIQTQITALKSEASGAFSAQLSQLDAALAKVSKAAQNLGSPPSAAQVQAVITALTNLKTASASAIAAMKAACP